MSLGARAPIEQSVIAGEHLREHFAATGDREAIATCLLLLASILSGRLIAVDQQVVSPVTQRQPVRVRTHTRRASSASPWTLKDSIRSTHARNTSRGVPHPFPGVSRSLLWDRRCDVLATHPYVYASMVRLNGEKSTAQPSKPTRDVLQVVAQPARTGSCTSSNCAGRLPTSNV